MHETVSVRPKAIRPQARRAVGTYGRLSHEHGAPEKPRRLSHPDVCEPSAIPSGPGNAESPSVSLSSNR